jgi:hypothetical protein
MLLSGGVARADNFPSHPVTIVVPFAAGGPSDVMARILAERMKTTLGETVLVENVTGAGGSIGVGRALRSPPDGYTISFGHLGTHVANGAIYKLGYDLVADLEPVALLPAIRWSRQQKRFRQNRGIDRVAEGEPLRRRQHPAPVREVTSPGSISERHRRQTAICAVSRHRAGDE